MINLDYILINLPYFCLIYSSSIAYFCSLTSLRSSFFRLRSVCHLMSPSTFLPVRFRAISEIAGTPVHSSSFLVSCSLFCCSMCFCLQRFGLLSMYEWGGRCFWASDCDTAEIVGTTRHSSSSRFRDTLRL